MNIIRRIPVKQILTESSKAKLQASFRNNLKQLEQECQQLIFEQKKLQQKKGVSREGIIKRFQSEITKRQEKIKNIEFQMEQLDILPIGSEIVTDEVETLVEVEVGYHWDESLRESAIIVKDGIVIEIK